MRRQILWIFVAVLLILPPLPVLALVEDENGWIYTGSIPVYDTNGNELGQVAVFQPPTRDGNVDPNQARSYVDPNSELGKIFQRAGLEPRSSFGYVTEEYHLGMSYTRMTTSEQNSTYWRCDPNLDATCGGQQIAGGRIDMWVPAELREDPHMGPPPTPPQTTHPDPNLDPEPQPEPDPDPDPNPNPNPDPDSGSGSAPDPEPDPTPTPPPAPQPEPPPAPQPAPPPCEPRSDSRRLWVTAVPTTPLRVPGEAVRLTMLTTGSTSNRRAQTSWGDTLYYELNPQTALWELVVIPPPVAGRWTITTMATISQGDGCGGTYGPSTFRHTIEIETYKPGTAPDIPEFDDEGMTATNLPLEDYLLVCLGELEPWYCGITMDHVAWYLPELQRNQLYYRAVLGDYKWRKLVNRIDRALERAGYPPSGLYAPEGLE